MHQLGEDGRFLTESLEDNVQHGCEEDEWCAGGVGSARCSLGTHPPCESSTCQRFKRRHVRRFGACAEADDTVVESWCVLSAPGV